MNPQLTHERCSELLGPFLARELEAEQHRLVEDHLAHCAQCSAERAALVALRPADEGLTGEERTVLRAGVLEAIGDPGEHRLEDESDADVVPLGRGSRAGKYLGIAAMLAILAVGSLFVLRGGGGLGISGGDDASTFGGAEDSGEERGEDADPRVSPEESTEDDALSANGVDPFFQSDRGALTEEDLDRLGRRAARTSSPSELAATDGGGSEETESSTAYTLSNRAAERTLRRLAARAPAALAAEIAECGRKAMDELDGPGLAAHATTATLDGREILAITFLTGGNPPDRYATFAFARGDCTTILASTEGSLE